MFCDYHAGLCSRSAIVSSWTTGRVMFALHYCEQLDDWETRARGCCLTCRSLHVACLSLLLHAIRDRMCIPRGGVGLEEPSLMSCTFLCTNVFLDGKGNLRATSIPCGLTVVPIGLSASAPRWTVAQTQAV